MEEEEEEEDYEDDDEEERGRETKPKPDYSRVMLAVPRSQPPAPARARRPGRF